VRHNVAREVKLRQSQRHDPERVFPSKAEIRLLLANVPARHRPLIVAAIMAGMRMSELRGLRWSDVDFGNNLIRVRQRADRYNEIGVPKSRAGRRDICLTTHRKTLNSWTRWSKICWLLDMANTRVVRGFISENSRFHWNHNPCVGGSSPSSATNISRHDWMSLALAERSRACAPLGMGSGHLSPLLPTMVDKGRRASRETTWDACSKVICSRLNQRRTQ
jgi:integrase